jgi:Fe-S cluster assembly protein SufD
MKRIEVTVEEDEDRIIPFFWVNGKEDEVEVNARLVGEGARLTILGGFLGSSTRHLIFNTKVIHEAPKTKSLTMLRGVFRDSSVFYNDGLVSIENGATGSDGFFASKVLLFDNARGRSVPSLEIDENDLKAGHASTVGRPDEEQLFYLQSRGLTEAEAIELIVSGFFKPLFEKLPQADREKTENLFKRNVQ